MTADGWERLMSRTVCVVTPVPLDRDSRTLKQVETLRRCGADVVTIAAGAAVSEDAMPGQDTQNHRARPGLISRVWSWARTTKAPTLVVAPFFLVWLCIFAFQSLRTSWRLPKASLFVLHGVTTYPAFALSARKAPFIYDIHDFYCGVEPDSEIGTLEKVFLRPFLRAIERRCIAHAVETVTVSEGLATLIENRYDVRPIVLRNVHDARLDGEPDEDIRHRLGLGEDAFLIVAIGNYKPGQRFEAFLEALSRSTNDVHLALIGRGYEALQSSVSAAGLSERVHILGALPPRLIVPSVRSADMAALPYYDRSENYRFSLPNGFFQSVGAGLPLIYPNLPEMKALAGHFDMGIMVDWSSAEEITAAIGAFRDDPEFAARLRRNAAQASQDLSWAHEELRWLEILSAAMPGK